MKKGRKTHPIRENGRFKNYPGEPNHNWLNIAALFWRACKVYVGRKKYPQLKIQPDWLENLSKNIQTAIKQKKDAIWWLGHATFLCYIDHLWIITDPVFGDLSSLFPRLFQTKKIAETLPSIDIILISHNHYDHLDKKSIQQLQEKNPQIKIFLPEGDARHCKRWGCNQIHEKTWWDETALTEKLSLTFVPAKHWSRRSLLDSNRSLWGGWVIQNQSSCIYFAGDTAMGDHFQEIQSHFGPISHALIPIGPCQPEEENRSTHLDPIQAAKAFSILQADYMIPCHWGTYPLGTDQPTAPLDLLRHWWNNQSNLSEERCIWLMPGENTLIKGPKPHPNISQKRKKAIAATQ